MNIEDRRQTLINNKLRVTPQRMAVLESVSELKDHPTAERIIDFIKINHPNIAIGTVYKILETFVNLGIINKVKTDSDYMRYDFVTDKHHHLYCAESDRIEDYFDNELNQVLENYFSDKDIPGFNIKDVKLQIIGNFSKD